MMMPHAALMSESFKLRLMQGPYHNSEAYIHDAPPSSLESLTCSHRRCRCPESVQIQPGSYGQ